MKSSKVLDRLSEGTADFWVDFEIERIHDCTPLQFCKQAYARYHPVILSGVVDDWPALNQWSEEYLSEVLLEKKVSVNVTPDGRADSIQQVVFDEQEGSKKYFIYPAEVQITISEFFRLLNERDVIGENNIIPYLSQQNDNLRKEFPELLKDIDVSIPVAAEVLGEPEAVNLWIGDERSVSSLHKDHFENLYVVVSGEKTFTLFPPTDIAFLPEESFPCLKYKAGSQSTRISSLKLTQEDLPSDSLTWISIDPDDLFVTSDEWPNKARCSPIRCTVGAGEMLYIPAMWYHRVSQTCPTIAVNMWFDQRFDFR
jgi:jumonji domain-containing protein 7